MVEHFRGDGEDVSVAFGLTTAADELNHFDAVPFADFPGRPLAPRNHVVVQFYSHAKIRKLKFVKNLRYSGRAAHGNRLTIDDDCHTSTIIPARFYPGETTGRLQRRGSRQANSQEMIVPIWDRGILSITGLRKF